MRKEKLEELKDYILELKTIKKERLKEEYKYENGVVIGRKGFLNIENYNCYLNNGEVLEEKRLVKVELIKVLVALCQLLKIIKQY